MKFGCLVLLLCSAFCSSNGFKVLGVVPFGGSSHFAIGHGIVKALHDAGHEITMISPFPKKTKLQNYHDISITEVLKQHEQKTFNAFDFESMHPALMMIFMFKMGSDYVNQVMELKNIQEFLNKNEKFDVCVIEIFNIDAFVGIADKVDCVLITYSTFNAVKWINDMTGNQMPPSYVPHPFLRFTDKMTFKERLENTFMTLAEDVGFVFHKINQRRLYNKYFPNAKRSFDEMYKSSSIIFLNQHVSYGSPRPLLPNMIEIGGIHIEPAKPLPKDIQSFLDSATDGAILFSMGSVVQAVNWPEEKREAIVRAFGKLKQKVIWKYENDTLPNKPDNVMISKWLPQRDIQAHPNVKLFITHGGLLGTSEALSEGMPVLGFPVFGDQKMNIAKAVEKGYGLQVYLNDLTEESVTAALNELLNNEKYTKNAKLISQRFNDRPMTPKESVVYWTEHAVRQKGASHLQAHAANLSFVEFYLIDVYLVLGIIAIFILFIDYLLIKFCIRCFSKKKPQTSNNSHKKRN